MLVALLLQWSFSTFAASEDLPQPPCDAAPVPAYPASPGTRVNLLVSQARQGSAHWTPPACTGWAESGGHGYHTLVALAGRFRLVGGDGIVQVLDRLGAISALRKLPYRPASAESWRPFADEAYALRGPEPNQRRPDFTAAELASGRTFYFLQRAGRFSSAVIYRLRIRQIGQERLLVQTENVTSIRFLLITLFQPGAVQSLQFIERLAPTEWGYYNLSRTIEAGTSSLADGHEASYVNRVDAIFRFMASPPG